MSRPLRVLLLAENDDEAIPLHDALKRAGYKPEVTRSGTEQEFRARLNEIWDVIVYSDVPMPFDSLAALRLKQQIQPAVPFIVISGADRQEQAARMLGEGAAYCLSTERLAELGLAIERVTGHLPTLQADADNYRRIVEHLQEGIWQIDEEARTIFANNPMRRLLGYAADEPLDPSVANYYIGPLIQRIALNTPESAGDGTRNSGEGLFLRKDGTTLWMRYSVSRTSDAHGKYTGAIGTFTDISERKRTEEALRSSEATLRAIFDGIEESIVQIGPDHRILSFNAAAVLQSRVLFMTELEAGKSVYDIVEASLHQSLRTVIDRALNGEFVRLEREFTAAALGMVKWYSFGFHPNLNADGRVTAVSFTASDITNLKATSSTLQHYVKRLEALRQIDLEILETQSVQRIAEVALARLRELIQVHHISVTIFGDDGESARILAIDEAAPGPIAIGQLYTKAPAIIETLMNRRPFRFDYPGDDAPAIRSFFVQKMHQVGMRSFAILPLIALGELRGAINIADTQAGGVTDDKVATAQGVATQLAISLRQAQLYETVQEHARDLEGRVQERTAELLLHRARFQTILEAMDEGVVRIGLPRLETEYVNRSFTELTGLSRSDVIDQPIARWAGTLSSDEILVPFAEQVRFTIAENQIWQGEMQLDRGEDGTLDVSVTVSRINDESSAAIGAVVLIRDITREKAVQVQRERFIANASHELRTPVTNLILRLYLMRKQPDQLEKNLGILEATAQHMKVLIEDLLQLSRFERGTVDLKLASIDLNSLAQHVVESQALRAEQKRITLEWHPASEDSVVLADPDRIIQVLDNLLTNALNYTHPGGRVTVRCAPENHEGVKGVAVHVQDTGVGISTADQVHLFEPFFRGQQTGIQGNGLGLAIAKEIMHLHKGTITVQSAVGVGSTFSIWLPLEVPVVHRHPHA